MTPLEIVEKIREADDGHGEFRLTDAEAAELIEPDLKQFELKDDENYIQNKFGYCFYAINNTEAVIFNLWIHPEYRRRGEARKILQRVITEIRDTGYDGEIRIEAIPRDGISLDKCIHFYQNMGLKVLSDGKTSGRKITPDNQASPPTDKARDLAGNLVVEIYGRAEADFSFSEFANYIIPIIQSTLDVYAKAKVKEAANRWCKECREKAGCCFDGGIPGAKPCRVRAAILGKEGE